MTVMLRPILICLFTAKYFNTHGYLPYVADFLHIFSQSALWWGWWTVHLLTLMQLCFVILSPSCLPASTEHEFPYCIERYLFHCLMRSRFYTRNYMIFRVECSMDSGNFQILGILVVFNYLHLFSYLLPLSQIIKSSL